METHPYERRYESVREEILSPRFIETALCRNEIHLGCLCGIFHKKAAMIYAS